MHFYTSVNINYLPKARILAKSVKKYCDDAYFTLVFSDKWPESINRENEPFDEIITIEELGIPVKNLNLWIFEHTVVELCTAVKGQALVKFLEQGADSVVYLDPDTVLFHDFDELKELLECHDVILTPHLTAAEEEYNAIMDNEICALKHGAYNFGFYAVKNSSRGLLFARWWRDRLLDHCFDDIPNGIFTDQKWGDLAPCLFEGVFILRDPGYNVSTWNISHREIKKDSTGRYLVNDVALKFYHFSGFDSGAQKDMLGLYGNQNECLYELRQWYIKRQKEEEQQKYEKVPSAYNFYDNGEKITSRERTMIRLRADVNEHFCETNPFVVEQEKSYYRWFRAEGYDKLSNVSKEDLEAEILNIHASKFWRIYILLKKMKNGIKQLFGRK